MKPQLYSTEYLARVLSHEACVPRDILIIYTGHSDIKNSQFTLSGSDLAHVCKQNSIKDVTA